MHKHIQGDQHEVAKRETDRERENEKRKEKKERQSERDRERESRRKRKQKQTETTVRSFLCGSAEGEPRAEQRGRRKHTEFKSHGDGTKRHKQKRSKP